MLLIINCLAVREGFAWPCHFTETNYRQDGWNWGSKLQLYPAQLRKCRFYDIIKGSDMERDALDGILMKLPDGPTVDSTLSR